MRDRECYVLHELTPTGDERVDALLHATVTTFEAAFPRRVRGYYLLGSAADGTSVSTSDVDLVILFKDQFLDAAEREAAQQLRDQITSASPLEYDAELHDEASLREGIDPALKLGSQLLYGEDVRHLPLVPIEDWARDRLHTSYWRVIRLFNRPTPVVMPVEYPDDTDEFYGYCRRVTHLPKGGTAVGTRDLIRSTGWAATAMIALRARQYVARKSDCHRLYRVCIGDDWSDLLEEIYTLCRGAWHYLLPDRPEDRARLRAICERTLSFENHFLAVYRDYAISQLRSAASAHRLHALWVLGQLPLKDEQIIAALSALDAGKDDELCAAARAALARLATLRPDRAGD